MAMLEFEGGLHLEGYINGDVRCGADSDATLSVSERGCIEGSVSVPNIKLERRGQRRHQCPRSSRIGGQGASFGQRELCHH